MKHYYFIKIRPIERLCILFSLILINTSFASDSLSYSGRLVLSNGAPVAGPVNLKVELAYLDTSKLSTDPAYISSTKCSLDLTGVSLTNGVFNLKVDFTDCTIETVLVNVPATQSAGLRVIDTTSATPKEYPFQIIHSMPYATVASQLMPLGATSDQFLKWNGTKWIPADNTITGSSPVSVSAGVVSISPATTSTNGYLSSSDWNTFNGKQGTIAPGVLLEYYRGDKTWQTLNTTAVPEGTNLYFTNAKSLGVTLDLFASGAATSILASDNVLEAFEKTQGQINALSSSGSNYVLKAGGSTVSGTTSLLGALNVLTGTGLISIVDAPNNLTDAANKGYVDTKLALSGGIVTGETTFDKQIKFKDGSASNYVTLKAPSSGTVSHTLVLPGSVGASGQVLTMTADPGVLNWASPSTSATPTGSAGGDLAGTYPNPTIAASVITDTHVSATAAIAQSKISNLATDLAARELSANVPADVRATTLTGYVGGVNSAILAGDTVLSAFDKTQGQLNNKESALAVGTSLQYYKGDKTWATLNTSAVPEGTNLYYTDLKAVSAPLNLLDVSLAGPIISADSVLNGFGKTQKQINDINSTVGALVSSQWTTSGSNIYRTTGNIGVGTTAPVTSAALDITSTTKGLLIPRMTSVQRGAITPLVTGLQVYDTTANLLYFYDGSSWQSLGVAGVGITSLGGLTGIAQTFSSGSAGTAPAINSSGTVHTLNIPMAGTASVTAGLLSKADYDLFAAKLGTASAFSGDISGAYNTTSVDKIKGTTVTVTSIANKNVLKYNGAAWINSMLASSDISDFNAGVLVTPLTGLTSAAGNITATDTVLGAFGKLLNTQSDYVSKTDNTATNTVTGQITFNNIGTLKLTYTPTNATDAVNKSYVDSSGVWSTNSGNAYRASGNVGIGTTNPAAKLHVVDGAGELKFQNVSQANLVVTGLNSSLILNSTSGVAPAIAIQTAGSTNALISADSNGFGIATSWISSQFEILKNGNVGIGTVVPTSLLSLGGTAARTIAMERNTTAATAGQGMTITSGGAIAGTANLAGGDLTLKSGISTGTGTSNLHFYTAIAGSTGTADNTPTEKMIILGSGNVGIGTASPTSALDIAGSVNLTGNLTTGSSFTAANSATALTLAASPATAANQIINIGSGAVDATYTHTINMLNNTGSHGAYVMNIGSQNLGNASTINLAGEINISTASNLSAINVNSTYAGSGGMSINSGQTNGWRSYINFQSSGTTIGQAGLTAGDGVLRFTTTGNPLSLGTSNADRLTIASSGNVGIGTTNPTAILHLKAGVATANGAPLKLTAGVNLTNPEAGAIEFDGTSLSYTTSAGARQVLGISGAGLANLNGLTGPTQNLAIGASGTTPAWTSSGTSHTLNIPLAASTSVTAGLLSKADYDLFAAKLGTASAFSGDISGAYNTTSVDKIKGTTVTVTSIANKNVLKYNGAAWINSMLASSDISDFNAGVLVTPLSGLTSAAGNITATDTVLGAFGKLLNTQSDYVSKTDNTATNTVTGQITFNSVGTLKLTYTPTNATDAVNKSYVDSSGVWSTNSGNAYRASGNVGIGTTAPTTLLHVYGPSVVANSGGMLRIQSSDVATVDKGASLSFSGNSTSSNSIFGEISGRSEGGSGSDRSYLTFATNGPGGILEKVRINSNGNFGIGTTGPTAVLHLKAGTAVASTAPLKFTAGVVNTTPEAGAVEYDGTNLKFNSGMLSTGNIALAPTGNAFGVTLASDPTADVLIVSNRANSARARIMATSIEIAAGASGTFNSSGLLLYNTQPVLWASTNNATASKDTGLSRTNVATLAVGNGTTGDYSGTLIAGRVGIGTTAPANSLSVVGVIESTTGGFKFPDGTIQTGAGISAASPTLTGTPLAPTAAVNISTTQIATTQFVLNQGATVAPLMDGSSAIGTSGLYARQDHVHASDTTRQSTLTNSAGLAGALSDETGSGLAVFNTSPIFATNITTPLLNGGTSTTQSLIYKTTTGVGAAGADHIFQVGNNGATEAMRILNSGFVGIGTVTPTASLHISGASGTTLKIVDNNQGAGKILTSDANGVATWQAPASSGTVTSVTGTAPIVSSGGTTPVISMAAATSTVAGYLLATDFSTFNGKASSGANSNITSLTGLTTALSVAQGGTGLSSGTTGAVPYYSGAGTIGVSSALTANAIVLGSSTGPYPLGLGSAGQVLTSAGTLAPVWVTSVPVANGGTGATTLSAYGVVMGNGTSAVSTINPTTSGYVLTSTGVSSAPTWQAATASDATKLPLAGGTMTGALINNTNSALPNAAVAVTQAGAGYAATFMGGNVGIGTTTPAASLHISGASGTTLKIVDSNQGLGKILTSDANGVATWQAPASSGTVTSVTGTAPIVSSGGNTPVISMAAATSTVAGYLLATDFSTFNGKASSGANSNITSLTGLTTALSVAQGGTGLSSGTTGAVPYYSGAGTIGVSSVLTANAIVLGSSTGPYPLGLGSAGQVLTSAGTLAPVWVTSVPVANGGTGATTLSAYGVVMGNGTSAVSTINPTTSGYVLTSTGVSSAPTWQAATASDATKLPLAGGTMTGALINNTNSALPNAAVKVTQAGAGYAATFMGGNVGIGNTAPSEVLEVTGNVKATAFFYSSDRRLKEDFRELQSPLSTVLKLHGVNFRWKEGQNRDVGFIAQEVAPLVPDLVRTSDTTGLMSVKYGNIVAIVVEAIKEMYRKVEMKFHDNDLRLANLEDENKKLKANLIRQQGQIEQLIKMNENSSKNRAPASLKK